MAQACQHHGPKAPAQSMARPEPGIACNPVPYSPRRLPLQNITVITCKDHGGGQQESLSLTPCLYLVPCRVWLCYYVQNVTLGGTGKDHGDRHPKISDNVLIGACATVLGNIRVGEGAQIAAGSLVLKPVAPHTMVAGSPAKAVGHVTGVLSGRVEQGMRSNPYIHTVWLKGCGLG